MHDELELHNHKHTSPAHTDALDHSHIYEKNARLVVIITAITMVVEIYFGYYTNSMALLVEGYHMSSHVFILGLSWLAYVVARKYAGSSKFAFNKEKLLALTGFSSALVLQIVAIIMAIEAAGRLLHPIPIKFADAIIVAAAGLVVNTVCALLLHRGHEHGDHNIRAAYIHVLSDAVTGIVAILALFAGMYYNMYSLDAISGIFCAVLITRWAVLLLRSAGLQLIEYRRSA